MAYKDMTIDQLKECVRVFVRERDWDQYNNAQTASMTVLVESIELLEAMHVSNSSIDYQEAIEQELADVFFSLLHFAIRSDIDIASVAMLLFGS